MSSRTGLEITASRLAASRASHVVICIPGHMASPAADKFLLYSSQTAVSCSSIEPTLILGHRWTGNMHQLYGKFKVLQYTGGHDLFSIGRRRSPAVSTADIPLVSQGAFFQHIHASEPEH